MKNLQQEVTSEQEYNNRSDLNFESSVGSAGSGAADTSRTSLVTESPVELVDVLNVSKQRAHLLRTDRQITLINDVGQVVLRGGDANSCEFWPVQH